MEYLVFIFLVIFVTIILAESTIKVDQALQDLDFVFEILVSVHPNIFFALSKEQAQEEFAKIGLEIKSQDTWKVRDLAEKSFHFLFFQ